jgi:alkylation response protein AidB-like acyl-CoA dehydrogenase
MDLRDSESEAAFRAGLRAWLAANAPAEGLPEDFEAQHRALVAWHKKLHAGGWGGLSWPAEYGGRALGFMEESILQQELVRAGAPPPPPTGYIGRAILLFGTEAQKRRYLPRLLSIDEHWCQGFSEPGAGSDLASLRTRATLDGDTFTVSGQKIWTSRAMWADRCLLLVRTSSEGPRQAGITVLLVDMRSPGITVRPIKEPRAAITVEAMSCSVLAHSSLSTEASAPGTSPSMRLLSAWSARSDSTSVAAQARP